LDYFSLDKQRKVIRPRCENRNYKPPPKAARLKLC
jgi:hypothetical protein